MRLTTSTIGAALAIILASGLAHGEIIPADRRIDWSPGVPDGIPDYPVLYDVKADFGAVGDDVADDTSAFASAIAAAALAPGHAVYVPEGTYRVTARLSIPSGVVIRGAGPTSTLIHSQHAGTTFTIAGGNPVAATTLSAAASKDAQSLQVVSAEGLSMGDLVQISRSDGVSQIVEVAGVSGSQVDLSGSLYCDFPAASTVALHDMVEGAGVEDLKIHTDWPPLDGLPGTYKVNLSKASRSWVRNVETIGYCGTEVQLIDTYQCEVRDSYFHQDLVEAQTKTSFDVYGIQVIRGATDTLIENNIFNVYRHAMVIQYDTAGGNVFGYNMSWGMYTGTPVERSFVIGDIEFHHSQVEQTLFEGNHAEKARVVGSSASYLKSNNTLLRNRITQAGIDTGHGVGNSFVGNELPQRKIANDPGEGSNYISTQSDAVDTIVHGNYVVYGNQGLSWDSTIDDRVIPSSYYLSEKPAWFGDLQWPAFGGDLMPNNTRRSPTEVRFWTMQFPEVAPSDLSLAIEGTEVHLSWTNRSTNPVDFVVVRSTDGSDFERIAETAATSYVDGGYASGHPRWYYVRARNHLGGEYGDDLGGESAPSNIVSTEDAAFILSLADCVASEDDAGSSTCTLAVALQPAP